MKKERNMHSYFAVILSPKRAISKKDMEKIIKRTKMSPVFFSDSSRDMLTRSRFYARIFNTGVVKTRSYAEFKRVIKDCAFTICDSPRPALFSLLSNTPAFIDSGDIGCRHLAGKAAACGCPRGIIIPYTKNRTEIINKVGATGSDFTDVILNVIRRVEKDIKTHRLL